MFRGPVSKPLKCWCVALYEPGCLADPPVIRRAVHTFPHHLRAAQLGRRRRLDPLHVRRRDEVVQDDNAGQEGDDLQPERTYAVERMAAGCVEAAEAGGQAGRPQLPAPAQLHVLDTTVSEKGGHRFRKLDRLFI
jgi:hypothetical protein